MTFLPSKVTFTVIRENWILLSPINPGQEKGVDDWFLRANKISERPKVVSDSHRDRTQEVIAKGFVRVKPKREFDISKFPI